MNLKNRWLYFSLTYAYVIILYILTNRLTLDSAHFLRMTIVDVKTPFLPWTTWVYMSVYIFPFSIGFFVDKDADVKPVVLSFVLMATFCTACFIFYPTVYPRPPLDTGAQALALRLVHFLDTPANCLPSLHVALGFLSAFYIQRYNRRWGNAALVFGIIIAYSTLTTKQHYLWDVLAGYFISRLAYIAASRFMVTPGGAPQ